MTRTRFRQALLAYGVLGVIGILTLDGDIRLVLLVFLAGLGLKSYIASLRLEQDSADRTDREKDRDPQSRP